MSDPYVGEIKMFAGTFAPVDYALCNGQLLNISDYETLFQLIGTTYGGDGVSTFGVPNLQSRIPVHQGNNQGTPYQMGQLAGTESVTLTSTQLPVHIHPLLCNNAAGTSDNPSGNYVAALSGNAYSPNAPDSQMGASIQPSPAGNSPHDNVMPFLCINFIISLYGIYPSPS